MWVGVVLPGHSGYSVGLPSAALDSSPSPLVSPSLPSDPTESPQPSPSSGSSVPVPTSTGAESFPSAWTEELVTAVIVMLALLVFLTAARLVGGWGRA